MAYIGNGPGVASQRILTTLTAVDGQTTFVPSAGYTLGYVDVFLNGVKLVDGTDYTAANGVNIVLTEAAALNDTVEVVTYFPRGLSDGYTKAEADSRYEPLDSAYTKAEADSRYEPIDSAYTKAESDARYVEVSGDTMTGNLTVPMVVTSSALSNRNRIINGEFLVWQRSNNGVSGGGSGYVSADRWQTTRGRIRQPNTNGNTGEDNRGAVFDCTDGLPYVHFDYYVEDVGQKMHGKTMTFSFYAKSLTGSNFNLYLENGGTDLIDIGGSTNVSVPTTWTRFTFTGTVTSTGNQYGVHMPRFYMNPTGSASSVMIQVDQVQLEEGDTATPFEHRSYGDELARCQRYFCTSGGIVVPQFTGYEDDFFVEGVGAVYTDDLAYSNRIDWPITMRAKPTITIVSNSLCSAANQAVVYSRNGGWNTCDVTSPNAGTTGMMIDLRDNGGFVNRDSCMYFVGYYAEAEL